MNRARLGTSLALAGLIGGAAWWLCWVPYQPARMLHAIPRDAGAVTVHRDLAGRQGEWLSNPVTAGLIALAVGSEEDVETLVAGPDFQTTLRRFGAHELVAAFVPQMGPLAVDSVVITAWLGGRSHWLRWGLRVGGSEMRQEPLSGGRTYWITDTDLQDSQGRALQFSMMFEEGLAIGCLSADPHNIRMVVGCYDRNLPSILSAEPRLTEWLMDAEEADRGWVRPPGLTPVRYAVTSIASTRLGARMRWEGDWLAAAPQTRLTTPSLFGSLPFASSTVSRGLVEGAARTGGWAGDVATLLAELDADGMAVSLFGGEYGGRLRGVRVPAAVMAVPCGDGPAGTALMHRIVHRIGLRDGMDLSVEPSPGDEPRIYSIATIGSSLYGELPAGERAAFCVVDDWLLLASNRVTLQRLLERREWAAGTAGPGGAAEDAWWMDLDLVRGEQSLRNALAAYWLVQVLGGESTPGMTQRLALVRSRLEQVATLGRLQMRAHPDEDGLVMELEVGR